MSTEVLVQVLLCGYNFTEIEGVFSGTNILCLVTDAIEMEKSSILPSISYPATAGLFMYHVVSASSTMCVQRPFWQYAF